MGQARAYYEALSRSNIYINVPFALDDRQMPTHLTATAASRGFRVGEEDWRGGSRKKWTYPAGPSGGITETIHGVEVVDTWRALEDLESDQTKEFIIAQNQVRRAECLGGRIRGADHHRSLNPSFTVTRLGGSWSKQSRLRYRIRAPRVRGCKLTDGITGCTMMGAFNGT